MRRNNSAGPALLGEKRRITSGPQKSFHPIYSDFIITPSVLARVEKKSISNELEFGSRDGKPSLGGGSASKMFCFSYPNY